MNYLYAPWREKYFSEKKGAKSCVFCDCAQNPCEDLGVFIKLKHCFGVMNKYPYASGHVMVIPYAHVQNIEDLDPKVWLEMSKLVRDLVPILKRLLSVDALNIGMNLGKNAGAGIAAHCHYHLVPRRPNDSNFITTISDTRVVVSNMAKLCKQLARECEKLEI